MLSSKQPRSRKLKAFASTELRRRSGSDTAQPSAIPVRNPQSVDGQHPGHPAPNQIDSQYRADHQGDANGGGVKDAQSPAACPGGPSVCGVDEQGSVSLQQRTDPRFHPLLLCARSKKNWSLIISTDKGLWRSAEHEPVSRGGANFDAAGRHTW